MQLKRELESYLTIIFGENRFSNWFLIKIYYNCGK